MINTRNGRAIVIGATGALVTAASLAGAGAAVRITLTAQSDLASPGLVAIVGAGLDACGDNNKPQQQGGTGTNENKTCANQGLVFNGPAIGNLAAVIGSTIIGPANVGDSITAAGNAIGQSPTGVGAAELNGVGA